MVAINDISGPSLGFHGLQVTQCPLCGRTQFFNNTRNRLSLKLVSEEGESYGFFIDPGQMEEHDLDGCYDLTVTHVAMVTVPVYLCANGIPVGVFMQTRLISCNGHTAKLEVSNPIDELDLEFIFGGLGG